MLDQLMTRFSHCANKPPVFYVVDSLNVSGLPANAWGSTLSSWTGLRPTAARHVIGARNACQLHIHRSTTSKAQSNQSIKSTLVLALHELALSPSFAIDLHVLVTIKRDESNSRQFVRKENDELVTLDNVSLQLPNLSKMMQPYKREKWTFKPRSYNYG